jgi:putative endonuclease
MDTTIERGATAEARAVDLLIRRGYHIVERNFRCKVGELDIVARDRGTLVFVEVRSRTDLVHGHALEAVGHLKQRKVSRVALRYIRDRHPRFDEARFDVVAVTGDAIELVQDAWRL